MLLMSRGSVGPWAFALVGRLCGRPFLLGDSEFFVARYTVILCFASVE